MEILQISRGVVRINIAEAEQWFLLQSDVHADSIYCNRKQLTRHLKQAVERDAQILIAGDLFDAMQGTRDPRRSYKELKKSLKTDAYFDGVLDDVWSVYKPYADRLAMVGYGNHEYAVTRHNGTDLVSRLAERVKLEGGHMAVGGYGTWVRFSTYKESQSTPEDTAWMYAMHGAGGTDSPVTRGVIQTNRQAVYLKNVDVVWNGHNHNSYIVPIATVHPSNKDAIKQDITWFLRTPGYQQGFDDGIDGWAVSRGMAPKPTGAIWMHLKTVDHKIKLEFHQDLE
jgi:hypothetical protein